MSQTERIDLILKYLYEFYPDSFCPVSEAFLFMGIKVSSPRTMKFSVNRLMADELIQIDEIEDILFIRITPKGKLFCEQSSYAYPNYPIITHKII